MNRLAIFDCDGTLVDSQHNICAAMDDAFVRARLDPPGRVATLRVVGLSLVEAMQMLLPEADDALHRAMADNYKQAFWRLRDSISEAERTAGPAAQHDVSVPVPAMPDFMIDGAAAVGARFPGTSAAAFGHLGDGNVHFHVRAPAGVAADTWYGDVAPNVTRFVNDLVVASDGSISAEHGIGQMKVAELARLSAPSRLTMLRAIKTALDPHNLFNPGKLVPLAPPPPAS